MKKTILALSITLIAACSTTPKNYVFPDWKPFGYDGLKERVDSLAGTGAINCGFVDLLGSEKSEVKIADKQLDRSQSCIDQAIKHNQPFKYGSVRIAGASYLWEIVLLAPDNMFWNVTYEYPMDETGAMHFVKSCQSLAVDVNNAWFDGKDCTDIQIEEWLAMPLVNPNLQE